MSTIGTLIDYAQQRVKMNRQTIGLPGVESENLIFIGDQADREYQDAFERGGEGQRIIKSEDGGTIPSSTNLASASAKGATSITVDSVADAVSSGGAGQIRDENMWDTFEYTDASTTTVTGVTDIDFAHEVDDKVNWLNALPSNFGSFRSTDDTEDGVLVDGIPYRHTSGVPLVREFSVYESSTGKYIIFPDGASGDYLVYYNKSTDVIDEETDSHNVPLQDEMFIVNRLIEHIYLTLDARQFAQLAQLARADANSILRRALKRRNIGKAIKIVKRTLPKPFFDEHYPPSNE